MVRKLLHLAKAEDPIFFVFFKMVTFVSALQPENALLPMDSTLLPVENTLECFAAIKCFIANGSNHTAIFAVSYFSWNG